MNVSMDTLYDDLMSLCAMDDTFYYKDLRYQSVAYRIFNYRLCSYATFHTRPVALNCRGTMFDISNRRNVQLVCLPMEKFFNYNEGFGRQQFHQRGRFGDKLEKMDGALISTFIHRTASKQETVRLKSKQSLTSKQAIDATELLTGNFRAEIERLVRCNYTVDMEYTSPSNHVVIYYPDSRLTILSIRSHANGETLFGSRLQAFLVQNNYPAILDHLVAFQTIPPHISHEELLQSIAQESYGEGYVVEIVHPDRSSYVVKIKTQKYLMLHRDGNNANSARSLFEAIIQEQIDDLRGLFDNDPETLRRIDEMEQQVRPKYNHMIESIEQFHRKYKHMPKHAFVKFISQSTDIQIYSPLLIRLYEGKDNDYKRFAMKHARDLFGISEVSSQTAADNKEAIE